LRRHGQPPVGRKRVKIALNNSANSSIQDGGVMKKITTFMTGGFLTTILVAGFAANCAAGPDSSEKLKAAAKAAWQSTKETAKDVAAETKTLTQQGVAKSKEIAGDVADGAKGVARKTAEISKDVAAKTKAVAVETHDQVKAAIKGATR
jgi:hypothetical protein